MRTQAWTRGSLALVATALSAACSGDISPEPGALDSAASAGAAGGLGPAVAPALPLPRSPNGRSAGEAAAGSGRPGEPGGAMPRMAPPFRGLPAVPPEQRPAGGNDRKPVPEPPAMWPVADPAERGPFEPTIDEDVGPNADFTMFRPKQLTRRHPVITWGNGTDANPQGYADLLNLYASHGFIVIASNSPNVSRGDPPPMLNGVTWVLEQDLEADSILYQHVDREQIGATGHSQGAFATSRAGLDERIKTIAPIEALRANGPLHGPVLGLCGTLDETVSCSGNLSAYMNVSDQPAMYAELREADHLDWIQRHTPENPSQFWVITTAWFRVQLMGDKALRPMFYGECSVCEDTDTWVTMRRGMDE